MVTNSLGMTLHPDVTHKRSIITFHKLPERVAKIAKHYENGACKYSYSKVVYENIEKKVVISCMKHGDFSQILKDHLTGVGCSKCVGLYSPTTEEFIEKAREVHGDRYNYDKVTYSNARNKVVILCNIHGAFEQKPNNHLQGQGCNRCGGGYSPTTMEWVEKARKVHGDEYLYDKATYKYTMKGVTITCKIHGDFQQVANAHLQGQGCRQCWYDKTNYDIYKDRKTTLYYVKFTHPVSEVQAWKIGLTLKTPEGRFKAEIDSGYEVEVIATRLFSDGYQAYVLEQYILKLFKQYRPYDNINNPYLQNNGNTEVFSRDILEGYEDSPFKIKE